MNTDKYCLLAGATRGLGKEFAFKFWDAGYSLILVARSLGDSWSRELLEFYEDIRLNRQPAAGLPEALSVLRIVQKLYKESGYDYSA